MAPTSPLTPTLSLHQLSQRMCGRKESVENTSMSKISERSRLLKGRLENIVGQVLDGDMNYDCVWLEGDETRPA